MNARIEKLNTIIRLGTVASLLFFVGAAKPAKRVAQAVKPIHSAVAVKVVAAGPVELLHDAVPAAALISPVSVEHKVRTLRMEVTAYCPCKKCCGENAQGITASGHEISYNESKFVAADTDKLPFGTKLMIPGYSNAPVEVIDRGGAIKGHKLDVFFPTHEEALQWGRQWVEVTIVE